MATCENCGTTADTRFCPDCGTAMPTAAAEQPAAPEAPTEAPADTGDTRPPPPPVAADASRRPQQAPGAAAPTASPGGIALPVIGQVPRLALFGAIGAIALLLGVGAWAVTANSEETVTGLFSLRAPDGASGSWDSCEGTGGYSDLDAGVPVRIEDQDGTRIGAATLQHLDDEKVRELARMELDGIDTGLLLLPLDEGSAADNPTVDTVAPLIESSLSLGETLGWCTWYWQAAVAEAEIYNFEIGRRGDIDVTRQQLADDGFLVNFGMD